MEFGWIKQRLAEIGVAQRRIAEVLGRDASAATRLIAGTRGLKAPEAAEVARVLQMSVEEFLARSGVSMADLNDGSSPKTPSSIEPNVVFPGGENKRPLPPARTADNDLVDRTIHSRDRTMPVYGRAVGGRENGYEFNGEVVDRVACPPQLQNVRDAYAVFVAGESMEPRYYEGEVLYVHPSRPTPPGSFVVVQLHPEREGDPRPGLVKQLVKKTSAEVVLRSLNPPDAPLIKIPMARVATVHAIVMAGAG